MRKAKLLWVMATLLLYACVTVNIYFPAQEVRKKAKEIVNEIRSEKTNQQQNIPPQSLFFRIIIPKAYASDVLNTTNATINAIKQRMKARYTQMKPFYQNGYLGETLNGFVKIYKQPTSLRDRLKLKKLVNAENSDRNLLYKEVAKALHIPSSQIDRVKKIFAKQWQDTAPKGTYIQTATGWIRK